MNDLVLYSIFSLEVTFILFFISLLRRHLNFSPILATQGIWVKRLFTLVIGRSQNGQILNSLCKTVFLKANCWEANVQSIKKLRRMSQSHQKTVSHQ
jgi:hypothetical protein